MIDEFVWLEDVEGEEALDWVRGMNARTEADLFVQPLFAELRAGVLDVLEADDRIPMPSLHRGVVTNFWTDAAHRRGLLRRTTWDDYRGGDPTWETVLDIDALSAAEGESWVFHGSNPLKPDLRRALIELSPGGSDASVTREFDMVEKRFIAVEEGGFVRPAAKGSLHWIDENAVYVATDFGPGSLTTSGYPRTVRRWDRGTPMAEAPIVFEGEETDVSVGASVDTLPGYQHHLYARGTDFYNSRHWLLRESGLVEIDTPTDASIGVRERWLMVRPRTDWTTGGRTYVGGSLLVTDLERFLAGDRSFDVLYEPTPSSSLAGWMWTRQHVVLSIQEHVRDRLEIWTPGDGWSSKEFPGAPAVWSVAAGAVDRDESDECLMVGHDFVTPSTLYFTSIGESPEVLRTAPARFDASGLAIEQHFATSADGTRIPYFVVGAKGGSKAPAATLLGGYGGFEISNTAAYSGVIGRSWLARGGTYALANIRGGGEYGPTVAHRWASREPPPGL